MHELPVIIQQWAAARLTALAYAVLGNSRQALRCWRAKARGWASPNAGPVMAAGPGALGVIIGGPVRYADEWHVRPVLGAGQPPAVDDIERASLGNPSVYRPGRTAKLSG